MFKQGSTIFVVRGGAVTQQQVDDGIFPARDLGKTEYSFSDGPAGKRGYSEDYSDLLEGLTNPDYRGCLFNLDEAWDA